MVFQMKGKMNLLPDGSLDPLLSTPQIKTKAGCPLLTAVARSSSACVAMSMSGPKGTQRDSGAQPARPDPPDMIHFPIMDGMAELCGAALGSPVPAGVVWGRSARTRMQGLPGRLVCMYSV